VREDARVSSAVSKAVDETGAVKKVGVVVNEVRRVPKEASKVSRDATTSLSISLIEFRGHSRDVLRQNIQKVLAFADYSGPIGCITGRLKGGARISEGSRLG
jgi:hypothetical protein